MRTLSKRIGLLSNVTIIFISKFDITRIVHYPSVLFLLHKIFKLRQRHRTCCISGCSMRWRAVSKAVQPPLVAPTSTICLSASVTRKFPFRDSMDTRSLKILECLLR